MKATLTTLLKAHHKIDVKFKNLKRSEAVYNAISDRISHLVEKFEDLQKSKITITVEMHNSPQQAGPDLFSIKLHITKGRYAGTTVTKSDSQLYTALADLCDHMLEVLNRAGDKDRVKKRTKARVFVSKLVGIGS